MDKFKSPMLASEYHIGLLKFPLLASPKIDGIRCVITKGADGLVDAFTRSGKPIRNRFIRERIGLTPFAGLDGELVVGPASAPNVYNVTSSGVMREDGEPDFTYWVFDLYGVSPDGRTDLFYDQRNVTASRIIQDGPGGMQTGIGLGKTSDGRIRMLKQVWLHSMEELDIFEAECLGLGYEGIMIRNAGTVYKYGRSTAKGGELLKVKRVSHDEAIIIGFEEQFTNNNEAFTDELGRTKRSSAKEGLAAADTLGAFVCTNDEKWPGQTFNVGPGVLTHAERKAVWDQREAHMGRLVSFKHLAHGAKDKPRHGRFNGFRDPSDMS